MTFFAYLSFLVVWLVTSFQVMFEDSKGTYAILQPSTDSLKAFRKSPDVGIIQKRERKISTYLELAA